MANNYQIAKKKSVAEKGFTLVELMVVVAITALIAGFTMAEINSTSHKLKGAARTLRAKMQQAKLLAVKENCYTYIDFDLNPADGKIDQSYTLWRDTVNEATTTERNKYNGGDELIETVLLPNDIFFGAVASGDDGGPNKSASNTGTDAPPADGISIGTATRFRFSPQGTGSQGWSYLHAPNKDSSGTYAVGSNNVGRVQNRYWVTNGGTWR